MVLPGVWNGGHTSCPPSPPQLAQGSERRTEFGSEQFRSSSSLRCHGSAEGERERLHARIEKRDLELPISNGLRLSDQLIEPLVGHRAVALLVNVTAMSSTRRLSIE